MKPVYQTAKTSVVFFCMAVIDCHSGLSSFLLAQAPTPVRTDSVTVSAVGDIMAHDTQIASAWDAKRKVYDFGPVFTYVIDLLSRADITLGNFETTLPGKPEMYTGYPSFGAPDAFASAMKDAGFDLLNTANNHCCDKGRLGLVRTLDALDGLGLMHLGTYRDEADHLKNRVLFIERGNVRLAFLGYTYDVNGNRVPPGTVVNTINRSRMAEDIGFARSQNPDFIIVLMHFGAEYRLEPDSTQVQTVDFLFGEGVDVVLGGHPHVLQPYELKIRSDRFGIQKSRLVIYSLGNFISSQRKPYRDGGIIFDFTLKKATDASGEIRRSIENVSAVPLWVFVQKKPVQFILIPVEPYVNNYQPFEMPPSDYRQMLFFYQDARNRLK
jgi:poly-gamma-glutamate synthesis protein (capsule biosynthesis protein)